MTSCIPKQVDTELYQQCDRAWHEIPEHTFSWLLECLPPKIMKNGGFVNSEPDCNDKAGNTYYTTCRQFGDKYYTRYATLQEFIATAYANQDQALPPVTSGFYWVPSDAD